MPSSKKGRLRTSSVVPTGQPHRRLANIASAVKPPGTTSLGFKKMLTESAMQRQPTAISARS